jgi:hypothetical protein
MCSIGKKKRMRVLGCVVLTAALVACDAEIDRRLAFADGPTGGTAQRPPGAASGPASRVLRIMPLGDSISNGGAAGGYRRPLQGLLAKRGVAFDFVGSQAEGEGMDPDTEGHRGFRTDNLRRSIIATGLVEAARPDIILLHIGTNDIQQGKTASAAASNLSAIIDDLLVRLPAVRVIVAKILPQTGKEAHVSQFNAQVERLVQSKPRRVSVIDMSAALSVSDLADGIHPNRAGNEKMAAVWEAEIRRLIVAERPSDEPGAR